MRTYKDNNKALTPAQNKAINLMLTGDMSLSDIAKEVGVHKNTISEWRRTPNFLRELKSREKTLLEDIGSYINSKASEAAKKLWEIANDDNTPLKLKADILTNFLDRSMGIPAKKIEVKTEDGTNEQQTEVTLEELCEQWEQKHDDDDNKAA